MDYRMIFIQSLGIIGSCVYFFSYQFNKNKSLFKVQIVSFIFYFLHFLLLKAFTGALSSLAALLRLCFLVSNRKDFHSKRACVFLCLVQVLVGIITFEGFISILPVIANVSLTIAGFSNSPKQIRLTGLIINSPLWIIYDIVVGSWAGVIDELITEVSIIISMFRYRSSNNNQ